MPHRRPLSHARRLAPWVLAWFLGAAALGLAQSTSTGPKEQGEEPAPSEARAAATRGLTLLQSSVTHWTREVDCFSCHHQGLGGLALALTDELGYPSDPVSVAEEIEQVHSTEKARFDALLVSDGVGVFGRSTVLLGLGVRSHPRDSVTDSIASFLAARQTASGAWYSNEHRPPFEDNHVTASALTLRALALYGPEGRREEIQGRIERGKQWLRSVDPRDTEERAMQLLGLAWCGEGPTDLRTDSQALLAEQREDGGWAQLPNMASDPYATGQALTVLHQAGGLDPKHPAFKKGIRFLLSSQREDGSWLVRTRRRIPGNRPKDSGYPHNQHQFVSFMAGCWATMALALSEVEAKPTTAFFGPAPPRVDRDPLVGARGFSPLHRAAAYGSFEEMKALVTDEAELNGEGPRGVTPLMLAVHDLRKVQLLVERGAHIHQESEWGFTPLLSATLVQGNGKVVEYLLERGAAVDCQGANGASPVMCAANVGDLETLETLIEAGGAFPGTQLDYSLIYAATCDDIETAKALLAHGANLDGTVTRFPSALVSATISGYDRFVQFTIERGADLESRDLEGMTALAWASKIGQAHTPILRRLIAAGAQVNSVDKAGKTPLDWAIQYRNKEAYELLIAAGAKRGEEFGAGPGRERGSGEQDTGVDRYESESLPGTDGSPDSSPPADSDETTGATGLRAPSPSPIAPGQRDSRASTQNKETPGSGD